MLARATLDTMAGMKVTLSAAMRARDVSRPTAEDQEAAEEAAAAASPAPRPGPAARTRTPRSTDDAARARAPRSLDDTDAGAAGAQPREDGGHRSRPRRKRR
ncbi:MAG: hypothetical protein ACLPKE_25700 [Streptosporangiaceae bacterium]